MGYPWLCGGVFFCYSASYNYGGFNLGSIEEVYAGMDASRCNPIYGNSSTVQPNSYVIYYIIKIN